MARNTLPYMVRRGHTFAFRLRVPRHLRPMLGCREIVRSLKTQNRQEAAPLALTWASRVKAIFAACETMTRPITTATLKHIIASATENPEKSFADLIAAFEHSNQDDLEFAEIDLNETEFDQLKKLLDTRVEKEFDQICTIADRIAPETPPPPPQRHPMADKSIGELKAYYRNKIAQEEEQTRQAEQDRREAARNKIRKIVHQQAAKIEALQSTNKELATQLATSMPKKKPAISMTWEDCLTRWVKDRSPATSSINSHRSSVAAFTALFPTIKIEDLEPSHFEEYRFKRKTGYGKYAPAKGTTIAKDEGFFTTLLGYARRARCIDKLPLEDLTAINLTDQDKKRVRPYTDNEIKTLFYSPIYTEGFTPQSGAKEGHGHYWLPLLMAYTGARIEELCQLTAAQVDTHEGVQCLLIYASRTRLKTDQSRRFVPLHSELIKLGFADHVLHIRKTQGASAPLFPGLKIKPSTEKVADAFSKWFGRYVERIGIQKKVLTKLQTEEHLHPCHSLRTTFINKMRSAEGNYRPDLEHLIVGHDGEDIHEKDYKGATMIALQRLINTVQYPGVDSSRHHNPSLSITC